MTIAPARPWPDPDFAFDCRVMIDHGLPLEMPIVDYLGSQRERPTRPTALRDTVRAA
jgi:hypothetical protein